MRILYDYSTGKYLHHDERLSSGNGSMYLTIQPLMIFGLGIFANVLMKLYGTSRLPAGTAVFAAYALICWFLMQKYL